MIERCSDCDTPDTCNVGGCLEEIYKEQNPPELYCCGDPLDCNEPCSIGVPADLDGRNESPVNRHGCSFLDCDCEVPCTSDPNKTVIINISGTMNGDINL